MYGDIVQEFGLRFQSGRGFPDGKPSTSFYVYRVDCILLPKMCENLDPHLRLYQFEVHACAIF
jgi:hypothetical protein